MALKDIVEERRARLAAEHAERMRMEHVTNAHADRDARDQAVAHAGKDVTRAEEHAARLAAHAAELSARAQQLPAERSAAEAALAAVAERRAGAAAAHAEKKAGRPAGETSAPEDERAAEALVEEVLAEERAAEQAVALLDAESARVDERVVEVTSASAANEAQLQDANVVLASTQWSNDHVLALAEFHLHTMRRSGHVAEAEAYADDLGARMVPPVGGVDLWDAVKPPPPPPPPEPERDRHGRIKGQAVGVSYDTDEARAARRQVLIARGAISE